MHFLEYKLNFWTCVKVQSFLYFFVATVPQLHLYMRKNKCLQLYRKTKSEKMRRADH